MPISSFIFSATFLAPATKEEYEQMFKYATTQKDHPVGIRIPASFVSSGIKDETDYSVLKNKVEIQGEKFAIFAVGCMLALAKKVAEKIKEEIGIHAIDTRTQHKHYSWIII